MFIWEVAVGEEPLCECEPRNTKNRYTAVKIFLVFRTFNIRSLTSPVNSPTAKLTRGVNPLNLYTVCLNGRGYKQNLRVAMPRAVASTF